MPRNMSFALTIEQFKNRTKTVTRREGWAFLKPGDLVMGCEKCMGFKAGEKIKRLGLIRILHAWEEPLIHIYGYPNEPELEGFPEMTKGDFVKFFCDHIGGDVYQIVTRIEFEHIF